MHNGGRCAAAHIVAEIASSLFAISYEMKQFDLVCWMDDVMTTFLRIYSIGFCGDEECVKMKLTKGVCGYL